MADNTQWLAMLERLKCTHCENYLSCPPIFHNDGQNICGRCPRVDGSTRNQIYETLAKEFRFPCRYKEKGCDVQLTLRDMPKHEESCRLRSVPCPLEPDGCKWTGPMYCVLGHCQKEHAELFIERDREFDINLAYSYNALKFYIFDNRLLRVVWTFNFDLKRLEFLVTEQNAENPNMKQYSCTLSLRFGSNISKCEFKNDCMTNVLYNEMLQEYLNETSVFGSIKLRKDYDYMFEKSVNNANLMKTFKCSKCPYYALPPIKENSEGEIVCSVCQEPGGVFRVNAPLGNLANLIKFSCPYVDDGCVFAARPCFIVKHAELCEFRDIACTVETESVKCTWKGVQKNQLQHLETAHTAVECPQKVRWDAATPHQILLRKFEYFYFQMSIISSNNKFNFFVYKLNGFSQKFRYRIILYDYRNPTRRITWESYCLEFEASSLVPMVFQWEQIAPFMETSEEKRYMHLEVDIFKDHATL